MNVLFLHVTPPLSLSIKSSHPLLWTDVSLWTDVCHPPPTLQLLASEIKQSFLSTYLACLLAFEQQAARLHVPLTQQPRAFSPALVLQASPGGCVGGRHFPSAPHALGRPWQAVPGHKGLNPLQQVQGPSLLCGSPFPQPGFSTRPTQFDKIQRPKEGILLA